TSAETGRLRESPATDLQNRPPDLPKRPGAPTELRGRRWCAIQAAGKRSSGRTKPEPKSAHSPVHPMQIPAAGQNSSIVDGCQTSQESPDLPDSRSRPERFGIQCSECLVEISRNRNCKLVHSR